MLSTGSLYGYAIESEVELRRLGTEPGARGRVALRRAGAGPTERWGELAAWIESTEGDPVFALARDERGDLIAWFADGGGFTIRPAAAAIDAGLEAGPTPLWEHFLVATVVPLLAAERGDLVPHAAAVRIGDRAVLFCGPSGAGKSTLALALAAAGHRVLAEDGAAVELGDGPPLAWPGARGICVADAVAAELAPGCEAIDGAVRAQKRVRLPAGTDPPGACEVGALVMLDGPRGASLELERLEPTAALRRLLGSLIFAGPDALGDAFSRAARLVDLVPGYRCRMPDALDAAAAAAAEVAAAVSAASPPVARTSASVAEF